MILTLIAFLSCVNSDVFCPILVVVSTIVIRVVTRFCFILFEVLNYFCLMLLFSVIINLTHKILYIFLKNLDKMCLRVNHTPSPTHTHLALWLLKSDCFFLIPVSHVIQPHVTSNYKCNIGK